jgi:putative ABC transport system permease protein
VEYASALYIGDVTARFANGNFQKFQVIGVDDATLSGAPKSASSLRLSDSVIVDSGGTSGKMQTPLHKKDMWSHDGSHLNVPTRELQYGDKLLINDKRVIVADVSHTIARFPPRPLLYTTQSNFKRLIPAGKRYITFITVHSTHGVKPEKLAKDISAQTGFKAITSQRFKKETVLWYMINSEDVGDMTNMVVLAMLVGFGVTGVMLYMFTYENIKQYAVLKAMGASKKQLSNMVFTQAFVGVVVGSGIGIAVAALIGQAIAGTDFPFRMMWFAPLFGFLGVLIVSITAAFISLRPILKMESAVVFKI